MAVDNIVDIPFRMLYLGVYRPEMVTRNVIMLGLNLRE